MDREVAMTQDAYESAVALVGMAGRFPGAADPESLWRNLAAGAPGLREITDEELTRAGVGPGQRADPRYVRVGAPVDGIELFDAAAFGFTAQEAELTEPQHRLFLECTWEALEHAGYCPVDPDPGGQVGVFAGCAFPDYMLDNVMHLAAEPGVGQLFATGNERDSLTSLVSYKLGLRGPSLTVQTFCSTSLVAVHLACQSLLTYECDLALAGGACLPLPQPAGYLPAPGDIRSPDGRVRSLDAGANGTVMGSGVGVVALKRMADALADGDVIHAVILGSAVNNDGRDRAGYAAPGVDGQAAVVETALSVAGVKPETVGYVECHAVGTPLGDSIELAALSRVFHTVPVVPCVLSSVKPSIGHLDRASGVTSLIRAALNLRHGVLPGTAGFQTPNPVLAAAADRFTVLAEDRPWPVGPEPRRAGVSSFAVGGTNAHVVLEQAPPRTPRTTPGPHLLTFSAGDQQALADLTERLRRHLAEHRDEDLADVAYTLQISRGRFALRRAVVCQDYDDAVAALGDPGRWIDGETSRRDPQVWVTAGEDVSGSWWPQLSEAVARLLPGDTHDHGHGYGHGGAGVDAVAGREAAMAALADGLAELGVRVAAGAPDGAGPALVVEPGPGSAADWVLTALARLWQSGSTIDWATLHRGGGRRVQLPAYPFQRSRYWVDPVPALASGPRRAGSGQAQVPEDDQAAYPYASAWRLRPVPTVDCDAANRDSTELAADLDARVRAAGPWLVLAADERAEALAERITLAGAEVVTIRPGQGFDRDEMGDCLIRPTEPGDLAAVLSGALVAPRTVVHGFSLATPAASGAADSATEQDLGFRSALALARLLAADHGWPRADLIVLTSGAVGVPGPDLDHPEHAALAALAPDLAREHPDLVCRHVDADAGADTEQVLAAMTGPGEGPVAVRGGEVWIRGYQSAPAKGGSLSVPGTTAPTGTGDGAGMGIGMGAASNMPVGRRRPRPALSTAYLEPEPGLQSTVADLWAAALGLDRIGCDDNFFDLGGRSVTAVQLATHVAAAVSVALPPTALLQYPTVRLLSAEILAQLRRRRSNASF
jgi:acyl transferase domain-containing protein